VARGVNQRPRRSTHACGRAPRRPWGSDGAHWLAAAPLTRGPHGRRARPCPLRFGINLASAPAFRRPGNWAPLGLWRWWRSFDQPAICAPRGPLRPAGRICGNRAHELSSGRLRAGQAASSRQTPGGSCDVPRPGRTPMGRGGGGAPAIETPGHRLHVEQRPPGRREPAGVAFPPRAAQQGDRLGLACASGVRAIGGRRPRFRQGRRSRRPRLSRTTTPGGARRIDRALDARERPWWSATRGGAQDFLVSQKISAISSILARSSSALPASISPLVPVAPASLVASLTRVCSCGYFSKCGGLK
jgi:hypothetical protein